MSELLLLALGAGLVNNIVLTHLLGVCPFVGMSRRFEVASQMALTTVFVLTLAAGLGYAAWQWLLQPLGLEHLRTLVFILLVAGLAQAIDLYTRATNPLLAEALGLFLPLATVNCAVLGVMLLNLTRHHGLLESLAFGAGAGAGYGLVLMLFAALRDRLETADVPAAFRGAPIALVTAGLMALAFMGFARLDVP
jgi:electron transport complex protein RnfA